MAEEGLDVANVSPSPQEVDGHRVPQEMRVLGLGAAQAVELAEDGVDRVGVHPLAGLDQEEGSPVRPPQEVPSHAEVVLNGREGRPYQGQDPGLGPLRLADGDRALVEVDGRLGLLLSYGLPETRLSLKSFLAQGASSVASSTAGGTGQTTHGQSWWSSLWRR